MKFQIASIVAGASALILSSCATTKSGDADAPTGPPSASLVFEGGQAAYWASASGGSGTLTYNGKQYPFSVKAAGAGGSGGQKLSATGQVYNLTSINDFAGSYTMVSSGVTIFAGTKHAKLTNSKGVVIYADEKASGIASSFGTSKVTIELK